MYKPLRTYLLLLAALLCGSTAHAQLFDGFTKHPRPAQIYQRYKVGFGLPFGQYGFNAEWGIKPLALNVGVGYISGTNVSGTAAFTFGLRGYMLAEARKVRPRLSANYGVNGVFKEDNVQRTAFGLAVGIGFEHRLTDRVVYDMDLMIPLNGTNNSRPANRELENRAIPSLGIGIFIDSPGLR